MVLNLNSRQLTDSTRSSFPTAVFTVTVNFFAWETLALSVRATQYVEIGLILLKIQD